MEFRKLEKLDKGYEKPKLELISGRDYKSSETQYNSQCLQCQPNPCGPCPCR